MSDNEEVPVLKARVKELEVEVSSLKSKLRRSEALLFEANSSKTTTAPHALLSGAYAHASTARKTPPPVNGSMARAAFKKDGPMTLKMKKLRGESTQAVRIQIVDWLNKLMCMDEPLTSENFSDRISSGVLLCDFVLTINESAVEHLGRIHPRAKPYSLLAHENVNAFINCAVAWGVQRRLCPASSNDVLNPNPELRDERAILFTLLALSRVLFEKFGTLPPGMVSAEQAIDALEDDAAPGEDGPDGRDDTGLTEQEATDLREALQAFSMIHKINPLPQPTDRRGEFLFGDGTKAHVRVFHTSANQGAVLDGVANGAVALLVRHKKKEWENLLAFANDHKHKPAPKPEPKPELDDEKVDADADAENPDKAGSGASSPTASSVLDIDAGDNAALISKGSPVAQQASVEKEDGDGEYELVTTTTTTTVEEIDGEADDDASPPVQVNLNILADDADGEPDIGYAEAFGAVTAQDHARFRHVSTNEIACMTEDDKRKYAEYSAKKEYFYLCAVSVKLGHELGDDANVISNETLWTNALEKGLPFHRFHGFIAHEITKKYLEVETEARMDIRSNLRSHREDVLAALQARQRARTEGGQF